MADFRNRNRALALGALAVFALATHPARAAPLLQDAEVSGHIGVAFLEFNGYLTAPGTASVLPNPYGTGSISALLGSSPTISMDFNAYGVDLGAGGGSGLLSLKYYVQYYNPGADPGATIDINFQTQDKLSQSGPALSRSYLLFSGPGVSYQLSHCITNPTYLGCSGTLLETGSAFPTSTLLTLQQNQTYSVLMRVDVAGLGRTGVDAKAHAEIDPQFIPLLDLGGEFIFSSGVTGGAVPEPATWALMIGGFGMAGAMLRRRKAVAA